MRQIMIIFLLLLTTTAFGQSLTDRAKNDELAYMVDADPAMRNAFEKARATLDDFLGKSQSPPPDTSGYALKVGIVDSGKTEYFWVNNFFERDGQFTGQINNEPRIVRTVRFGQRYTFAKSQIVDWVYVDRMQRKMVGNFTACALLTKEPPREREAMKRQYGLECD